MPETGNTSGGEPPHGDTLLHPALVSVRPLPMLRLAVSLYRRHPWTVAWTAAIVFGIAGLFDTLVGLLSASLDREFLLAFLILAATSLSTIGTTFYAGLLDEMVGGDLRGEPQPRLHEVIRELPWARLLLADVVLVVVVTAFSAGFVVIGLVAYTLFAVVGPVINIEKHGVLPAFARSARLVRRHFLMVLFLVTLPIGVEHAAVHAVGAIAHLSVVPLFAMHALVGIAIGSIVGLVEVVLAYALIAEDHSRTQPPSTRARSTPN